jgi:hypothetical protein
MVLQMISLEGNARRNTLCTVRHHAENFIVQSGLETEAVVDQARRQFCVRAACAM